MMLGLVGLLGALIAGMSMDSLSVEQDGGREAEDSPPEDADWTVSTAFMDADPAGPANTGGTDPDGQPVSDDVPDTPDPDLSLSGGKGDDVLQGRGGADALIGAEGQDQLYGGEGQDVLAGGDGDDGLWGDAGGDALTGDAGDDLVAGCEGDDSARGDQGDDSVIGGTGDDSLAGQSGDDLVDGGTGRDALFGGDGADELEGGAGNDTLWGDGDGDGGPDAEPDFLNGGRGGDALHLGAGDYGNGGQGADAFTLQDFAPGKPVVQITDFDPAEDQLVVIYDAALHPDPQLTLGLGGGATLLMLDGVPLASLTNGAALDLATVRLQAA